MERVSLSQEEIQRVKAEATREGAYSDRVSLALALELLLRLHLRGDYFPILDEIEFLEGVRPSSRTKDAEPFRQPPLDQFWHKHFSSARHLLRNLGIRWGLDGRGNRDLSRALEQACGQWADDPERLFSELAHRLIMDGYGDRLRRGLTGEWIIFTKHDGRNYYLSTATHQEGKTPAELYERIRGACGAEFPFLFLSGRGHG